jgi:hypothetical protein
MIMVVAENAVERIHQQDSFFGEDMATPYGA